MGVLLLVRVGAGHRLPLPLPGSSPAAARLPRAGRRLPRQRLLESPVSNASAGPGGAMVGSRDSGSSEESWLRTSNAGQWARGAEGWIQRHRGLRGTLPGCWGRGIADQGLGRETEGSHRSAGRMLGEQRLDGVRARLRDNRGSEELRSVCCWGFESLGRRRSESPGSGESEAQWLRAGGAGAKSRDSVDSEEWWLGVGGFRTRGGGVRIRASARSKAQ